MIERYEQVRPGRGSRSRASRRFARWSEYDGATRYAWKSVSEGLARYGGRSELRYEGWATTTGPLARREEVWAPQAQREAEAELAAIKEALEEQP